MSQIDEIKSRLDIIDIISEYINLKPAGSNHKALCPFHNEKTPSFMVSREKQIWHCFGCGKGGDIFAFVQEYEGVEFPEALRILAGKAGIVLKKVDPQLANQKTHLFDICETAANFFHQLLLKHPRAQIARDYIEKRGLNSWAIENFRIGYAPNSWDALSKYLKQKKFSEKEIFLAGLTVKKDRDQGYYDRFRNRLMFPITDVHSNVTGFTARVLDPENDKMGKYINTPQTLIYNKSAIIYGLDKAKAQIKKENLAVLVEGQMDVISSHQAGVTNVVASSGTALTSEQVALLKRFTNNIALSFDVDLAGQEAAKRGIDIALANGMNTKVIQVPQGKDPDECIKSNVQDWISAIKQARGYLDYYFEKTFANLDLVRAENKKQAAKILLPVITKIFDKVEQTHYLQILAEKIKVSEQILRESLPKIQQPREPAVKIFSGKKNTNEERIGLLSDRILALMLKFPENISYAAKHLLPEMFADEEKKEIYKNIIIYYTKNTNQALEDFLAAQNKGFEKVADRLILLADKDYGDFEKEGIRKEVLAIINFLKKNYILKQLEIIQGQISALEGEDEKEKINKLSKEFDLLAGQLNTLI